MKIPSHIEDFVRSTFPGTCYITLRTRKEALGRGHTSAYLSSPRFCHKNTRILPKIQSIVPLQCIGWFEMRKPDIGKPSLGFASQLSSENAYLQYRNLSTNGVDSGRWPWKRWWIGRRMLPRVVRMSSAVATFLSSAATVPPNEITSSSFAHQLQQKHGLTTEWFEKQWKGRCRAYQGSAWSRNRRALSC